MVNSSQDVTCPKCSATMEAGFTLEIGPGSYGTQAQWIEGVPETRLLSGLKTKGKRMLPIEMFRCQQCGYLESYARSPQRDD